MSAGFDKNVFINCPFDDDYRPILEGVIFTVLYFGFRPRLALESADSGKTRIDKIVALIKGSKFGIHDLSRMVAKKKGEHYRMNMPFELGVDYGCSKLKSGKCSGKKILILEKERYRFQKALSDLSGSDIRHHDDDPLKAVKAVRDWFVTEELNRGDSDGKVWDNYNDFQAYLHDEVVVKDGHDSVEDILVSELMHHMKKWFSLRSR